MPPSVRRASTARQIESAAGEGTPQQTHPENREGAYLIDECLLWGGDGGGRALRAPKRTMEKSRLSGKTNAVEHGACRFFRRERGAQASPTPRSPPAPRKGSMPVAGRTSFPEFLPVKEGGEEGDIGTLGKR